MKTRISSRWNSWWKLHHGTSLALNIVIRNRVCYTTEDGLSALTLHQGHNSLSTLLHHMLMMLQMLWMMTIMPQCWKVCHYFIFVSNKNSYQEGTRARPFHSHQEMGYFTRESSEYNPSYHTSWGQHSVAPVLI